MKHSEHMSYKVFLCLIGCIGFMLLSNPLWAQCPVFNNGVIDATASAPSGNAPKTISNCVMTGRNVQVTGLAPNTDYAVNVDGGFGGFATIYESSNTRTAVASGSGTVLFTTNRGGNYIIAISADSRCSTTPGCKKIDIIHHKHCGSPHHVNANPNTNGALISWGAGAGAYQWNLVWSLPGGPQLGNTSGVYGNTSPAVNIGHLQPCTTYEYYIYETCKWISTINGPYYFTTGGSVCVGPSGVNVSNITTTGADVNWTPGAGSQTYTIFLGYENFAGDHDIVWSGGPYSSSEGYISTYTGTIGTNGPPVSLTGLLPKLDYEIYIVEDCGPCGLSDTIGPIHFMTPAAPQPPAIPCTNGGFEDGTFMQWAGSTWENSRQGGSPIGTGLYFTGFGLVQPGNVNNSRHTLMPDATWAPSGFDPLMASGSINLPVVSPFGGGNSARLGNPQDGYGAERLEKRFLVDQSTTTFFYAYAIVLEDSHNPDSTQAFFTVRFYDENCNLIVDGNGDAVGVTHNGGASDALLTQVSVDGSLFSSSSQVFFRNWDCQVADLTAYLGQEVTVEFTTSDCGRGGHFGYAYVDDVCTTCDTFPSTGGSISACVDSCGPAPVNAWGTYTPPFILDGNGTQINGTPIDLIYTVYQTNGGSPTIVSGPTSVGTGPINTGSQSFNFSIPASAFPTPPDGFDIVIDMVFAINGGAVTVTDGTPGQGLKAGVDNDVTIDCGTGCPPITPVIDIQVDFIDLTNDIMGYTFTDNTSANISHIEWIIDGTNLTQLTTTPFATTNPPVGPNGPFPSVFQVGDNPGTSVSLTYSPTGLYDICLVTFYYVGGVCCHDTVCVTFGCIHGNVYGGGSTTSSGGTGRRVTGTVVPGGLVAGDIVHNPIGNIKLSSLDTDGIMSISGFGTEKLTGFASVLPSAASYKAEIEGLSFYQDGDRAEIQVGVDNAGSIHTVGGLSFEKNGQMLDLRGNFEKLGVNEVLLEVENHGKVSKGIVSVDQIATLKGLNSVDVFTVNTDDKNQTQFSFVAKGKIMVFADGFNAMGHKVKVTLLNQTSVHHINAVNYLAAGSVKGMTLHTETIRESLEEGECYEEVYEPNDVTTAAYAVFPRYTSSVLVNARLCQPGDVDWYTFDVSLLSKELHEIKIFNLSKDYDLEVYDAQNVLIATGSGSTDLYERILLDNLELGTYYVKVWSRGGESDPVKGYTLEIKESGEMAGAGLAHYKAINVKKTFGFNLYPNPTTGIVQVGFEASEKGEVKLQVFDLFGKLLKSSIELVEVGQVELNVDLKEMSAGTYLIQISQNGKTQSGKVVLTQ